MQFRAGGGGGIVDVLSTVRWMKVIFSIAARTSRLSSIRIDIEPNEWAG